MTNFVGLETLDNVEEDDFIVDDNITEELSEIIVLDEEYEDTDAELSAATAKFDLVFAAMDDVAHLMRVIEEHGISKSLMAHADPDGFLTQKLGLPALETLDATPINDANAQAALEGLKETLKKWGDAIRKFFKMISEKLKAVFVKVVQMFTTNETIIRKLIAKMGEITLDAAKAKEKKIKALKASELADYGAGLKKWGTNVDDTTITRLIAVASTKDEGALNAELLKLATGAALIGFEITADGVKTVRATYDNVAKEGSVTYHGYTPSVCKANLTTAIGFTAFSRSTPKLLKAIDNLGKTAVSHLESMNKSEGKNSAEEKEKILKLKRIASVMTRLIMAVISHMRKFISMTIMTSNAVIACKA